MKIAIVNDTLDEFGGAERVALYMLRMFPQSDFYTSFAAPWILQSFYQRIHAKRIHTSWKIIPHIATHRSFIQMFSPLIWGSFDLSSYDVVITNPSLLMCNIVRVPSTTIHIQYIHSIPKNLYGLLPETPLQRSVHYDRYIRPFYQKAVKETPYILTSSTHMQQKIKDILHVHAEIMPPPVHVPNTLPKRGNLSYYLYVSRLDRGKNVELAIQACNTLRVPLYIVGVTNEPRYEEYLHEIAGPTIRFLGFKTDKEVEKLYEHAIAFLFPSEEEDFGIAPLEALAHGVPVIAYSKGGPEETLKDGKTGVFFHSHTGDDVVRAMKSLQQKALSPRALHAYAKRFSEETFKSRLTHYITAAKNSRKQHP